MSQQPKTNTDVEQLSYHYEKEVTKSLCFVLNW